MSRFQVIIERKEEVPPHGFEIGHMTFIGSTGTASTKDPPRGVMVYVAILELLDGLHRFLSGRAASWEFVGTDSSLLVLFRRKKGDVSVSYRKVLIADVRPSEVATGTMNGVTAFLARPEHQLSKADPVADDLSRALSRFADLVANKFS